jgi:hypothetical protein
MTRLLLERLRRGIFKRRARVAMGLGTTTQEPMDIKESNDKNKEEGVGAIQRFIEVMIDASENTKFTQKEV